MLLSAEHLSINFGSRQLLEDVNFYLNEGDKVGVIGINGTGKSTFLKVLAGRLEADAGTISRNPNVQVSLLEQNPPMEDDATVLEQVFLHFPKEFRELNEYEAKTMLNKLGLPDYEQRVGTLSGGQRKRVALAAALIHPADVLILDEPTAVLTPQETRRLFDVLRRMREDGKSIIIITHKLHEVLEISDRVVILRKGKNVGNVATKDATEQSLTEMMVGEKIDLHIERTAPKDPQERLRVEHLTVRNKEGAHVLEDVNFTANGGEILGIAGISGCGQKELLEAIAGLQASEKGSSIVYKPTDGQAVNLVGKSPKAIRSLGIALSFVPEDRLGMGLVGNMDIVDNMMLRSYKRGHTAFLERKRPKDLAENIIKSLEIVTPDANTPVRRLSGGNVQKVLVGREIDSTPTVLMTAYPVRGLDINSSYTIYGLLNQQKMKGVAVLLVGEDLDVLLELCDRILVLCGGKVSGIVDGRNTTKEEVGLYMTHVGGGKEAGERA